MEWTDIRLTVAKADADNAEAVATMIAEGGIYIEDYSDIEQQVAEIAHVDLIEQELLDKPRDTVIIHMYLEPGASPVETLALIAARMEAANIAYTVETEGVEQEDWQNGWRKYYHPLEIGKRLAVVPSWQQYDTDRVKLILDPGLAFGTGIYRLMNMQGLPLPSDRIELAELVWERAGKPEPQNMTDEDLYADIDAADTDAQKAAHWMVEQELMKFDEDNNKFHPCFPVSKLRVCLTWQNAKDKGLID